MCSGPTKQPRTCWPTARRLLWVVLAAAHIPALNSAWASFVMGGFEPERLGGCVALTATMLFFVLKLLDLEVLRLRSDRRSLVAVCLIVLLMHAGVFDVRIDAIVAPECVTLIMTALLVAGLARASGVLVAALGRGVATLRSGFPLAHAHETAWSDCFRPHCWVLTYRLFTLRAPPA